MKKLLVATLLVIIFTFGLATYAYAATHTVRRGDVLWRIARTYNTTYYALAAYNQIENPHLIFPGQVIRIPAAATPTRPPAPIPNTIPEPYLLLPLPQEVAVYELEAYYIKVVMRRFDGEDVLLIRDPNVAFWRFPVMLRLRDLNWRIDELLEGRHPPVSEGDSFILVFLDEFGGIIWQGYLELTRP
jgi:murein DD-endopeptidase MepM/ murein hydrolase activator NlpD